MSDLKKRSVEIVSDLAKQFIGLGLGGLAFAIAVDGGGVAQAGASSFWWWAVVAMAVSVLLGFLCLMHFVGKLAKEEEVDVYARLPRALSVLQILTLLVGAGLLLYLHVRSTANANAVGQDHADVRLVHEGKATAVTADGDREVVFEIRPDGSVVVTVR